MIALLMSVAFACDLESKVVGFAKDQILVRVEQKNDAGHSKIDLRRFEKNGSEQTDRFPILEFEDEGDAKVRSERWKAAEKELLEAGFVIDSKPVDVEQKQLPKALQLENATIDFRADTLETRTSNETAVVAYVVADGTIRDMRLVLTDGADDSDQPIVHSVVVSPSGDVAVIASGDKCKIPAFIWLDLTK